MLRRPRSEEPEGAHRVSPSFAKKAAACLKPSRSSRRTVLGPQPAQLLTVVCGQAVPALAGAELDKP
jgi:hypothetical protein